MEKIQNPKSETLSLLQIPKGMSVANFRSYGPFSWKKIDFPLKIAYRKKRRENHENQTFFTKNRPNFEIFQKYFGNG